LRSFAIKYVFVLCLKNKFVFWNQHREKEKRCELYKWV